MDKQDKTPELQVTDVGLVVNITLPPKKFKTGKEGFFKQGIYYLQDGKKYRINFQAYEID